MTISILLSSVTINGSNIIVSFGEINFFFGLILYFGFCNSRDNFTSDRNIHVFTPPNHFACHIGPMCSKTSVIILQVFIVSTVFFMISIKVKQTHT